MRALCFDPGETTGWAIISNSGELIHSGEITTFHELANVFSRSFPSVDEAWTVLIEQIPRGRHSFNPIGFEWSGAIKFLCYEYGIVYKTQAASILSGPRNWPGVNLRTVKGRHARDAVAHGLAYFNITEFPPRKEAEA